MVSMWKKYLTVIAMILITGNAFAEPPLIKVSEIRKAPIAVGDLRLRIWKISSFMGAQSVILDLENVGKTSVVFDPLRFSFVLSDGHQVDVMALYDGPDPIPPRPILLNGGAHLRRDYRADDIVSFPAKIYYDGKLIADLID